MRSAMAYQIVKTNQMKVQCAKSTLAPSINAPTNASTPQLDQSASVQKASSMPMKNFALILTNVVYMVSVTKDARTRQARTTATAIQSTTFWVIKKRVR